MKQSMIITAKSFCIYEFTPYASIYIVSYKYDKNMPK